MPPPLPDPTALIAWYDRHRRDLPWRVPPGERADPYRVWLSEIMLQQTNVATVKPYFARFLGHWPDVAALAAAPLGAVLREWAGLGYYSRARNLHACARLVVERHGGRFPADEAGLMALPGIGAYTAAAIAAIAFEVPATVVDGNVERVVARLFRIETPLPAGKSELRRAAAMLTPRERPGDFAQAMMDLGATICAPRRPACGLCPFQPACRAHAAGVAAELPRRLARREAPWRHGAAFVVTDPAGRLLLRTRPAKGLLGGMSEVPTSAWRVDAAGNGALDEAPFPADWRRLAGAVEHVFTHFPLRLAVWRAELPAPREPPAGARWVGRSEMADEAFPTLMRKVLAAAGVG